MLDLEEEIRKVCERFGVVKKVVVYDVSKSCSISAKNALLYVYC